MHASSQTLGRYQRQHAVIMWIPEPIYRSLPLIYAAGGFVSVGWFGIHSPAILSAVLLLTASSTVIVLRMRHRAGHKAGVARTAARARRVAARPLTLR
jgi:hypothetical protein